MKLKIFLLLFFIIVAVSSIYPQCVIRSFSVTTPANGAIRPRALHFCVGDIVSNVSLQILPMSECIYRGDLIQVDSFQLQSIAGIPAWADYICFDPTCIFRAGIWTCMALSVLAVVPNVLGTDTVKLYNMSWNIRVWAKSAGNPITVDTPIIFVHLSTLVINIERWSNYFGGKWTNIRTSIFDPWLIAYLIWALHF